MPGDDSAEAVFPAARPIRVLYLHHYGPFGGSSRSLLELISNLGPAVEPRLLAPRGQSAELMAARGIPTLRASGVSLFDNSRYSHYRGLRWLVLAREIARLPATYLALRRALRLWPEIDIVHVNEAHMLPSILIVRRLLDRPVVVHVRAVQRVAGGLRQRWVSHVLSTRAARLIAIDETVKASLPSGLRCVVVHNGLTPPASGGGAEKRPAAQPFTVGMVGNLLRVKGCLEFAQAAAICRARGLDVHFSYVGQSPRPTQGLRHLAARLVGVSQEIEAEVRAFVARERLEERVHFQPFSLDLADIYGGLDVVCFPSHLDAPGRPIFEAAFYGVPAIAAISDPKPDTFLPGETGLVVPAADPSALADAVELLYRDPARRERMGAAARALAKAGFDARTNAGHVLQLYRDVLAERAGGQE